MIKIVKVLWYIIQVAIGMVIELVMLFVMPVVFLTWIFGAGISMDRRPEFDKLEE